MQLILLRSIYYYLLVIFGNFFSIKMFYGKTQQKYRKIYRKKEKFISTEIGKIIRI